MEEEEFVMSKQYLLSQLHQYSPSNDREQQSLQQIISLIEHHNDYLSRHHFVPGHITASAWLVDQTQNKVLLTFHKKLKKWLQLGGHIEDETDVATAALREAKEESGLAHIKLLSNNIFHVDVHEIPERKNEPSHYHFDICFLFQTSEQQFQLSDESLELRWFDKNEINDFSFDDAVQNMFHKWLHK